MMDKLIQAIRHNDELIMLNLNICSNIIQQLMIFHFEMKIQNVQ